MALLERSSMSKQISLYPSTFYRVSLKAIIRNEKAEVLMVQESSDSWSLPGGGIDHGETHEEALGRELYEEALITQSFTATIIGIEPIYIKEKQTWMMWVVYDITFKDPLVYGVGADAKKVAFIDPYTLEGSSARAEALTYQWTTKIVL
jgi:8-oxo-dGTP pyrophosphatase MutT (NUDIX family)